MQFFFSFNDVIAQILSVLSLQQYGVNILDLIIIFVFLFYIYEGYVIGFALSLLDLFSFVTSFLFGLLFFDKLSSVILQLFSVPLGFANAVSFLCIAGIFELVMSLLLRKISLPVLSHKKANDAISSFNHFLGVFPGIACAYILLSFLLTVIVALPSSSVLKNVVATSHLGSTLVAHTAHIQQTLDNAFRGGHKDSINVLTVKPESDESIKLHFTVASPVVDQDSEEKMFKLVNYERERAGLEKLSYDKSLTLLARAYAKEMLQEGFFSHYDLRGGSPFDRMAHANIMFLHAGENLALSPGVTLAHQGLMNSPGHRANILSTRYQKVGIGVMDGGIYGLMFVQEFTN